MIAASWETITARCSVAARLLGGWVPWRTRRSEVWAHPEQAITSDPVTPAEGVVLDELVYIDTDTGDGPMHFHSYRGAVCRHHHADGNAEHMHLPGEAEPSWCPGAKDLA